MSRVFLGVWNRTIAQITAHYVHKALLPLCDAVINLHSGEYSLSLVPYLSTHYPENDLQNKQTFAALQAFEAPVSLIIREIGG